MAKGKYSISTRYFQPAVKFQLITLQEASRNALYISHYISLGLPSCISYMFNELTALNAYIGYTVRSRSDKNWHLELVEVRTEIGSVDGKRAS